ncbi:MAG TPA: SURF1 family protein [Kribbellaceae bacterium]
MNGVWRTALSPRWLALLLVAVLMAAGMTALGLWQLGVYRSKTAAATAARVSQPPVPLPSLLSVDDALSARAVGRKVTVTGRWAPAADQIYVSGRPYDGRPGYWVVTPVLLADGNGVLVVRGWVPSPGDPAAAAPSGPVTVTGTVVVSEAEDASGAAAQGRILPSLRLPTIVGMVSYRLYDAFVMQSTADPAPAPAPAPVAPPAPPTDRAGFRNVAYAVQWWIFAAFVLFMWWRMMTDDHRARTAAGAGTVAP